MAVSDPAAQNGMPGDAGTAFAMAFGEASGQSGPVNMAGSAEGEAEGDEKESDRQAAALSLSGISALLMQGAYLVQQAAEAAAPDAQAPFANGDQGAAEDLAVNTPAGGVQHPWAGGLMSPAEMSGNGAAMPGGESTGAQDASSLRARPAQAGGSKPETALQTAKGKDQLDQSYFENVLKPSRKGEDKAAEFVGVDSAREVLNPAVMPVKNGEAALEQTPVMAPGRDKDKPVQVPFAAMAAARGTEGALQAESIQSTPDMAPENTVREENAAMQVARSSVRALKRGMAEYRIRLSPEGLGDVEVTVVAKGRAVSLSLRTENETAKGLILNHADELRAELSAQEYQVSGLNVEVGMDSRGGAGFLDAREYAEAASENGRAAGLRDAASMQDEIGPQADTRRILPKSSTISYRV